MKLNDKSIWIRLFEKYITDVKNNIVVTDVRFANEAQSIKDLGGYIIKLERFHETDSHNITNDHQSETQNDIKYNFVIRNDGSIEDLKKNIPSHYNPSIQSNYNGIQTKKIYFSSKTSCK